MFDSGLALALWKVPVRAGLNWFIFVPGQGWSGSCVKPGTGGGVHKTRGTVSMAPTHREQKAVYTLPNMTFREGSLLTCKLQQRGDGKDRDVLCVSKPVNLEHLISLLNLERKKKDTVPESG